MRRRRNGLTLIEVLLVCAVSAILMVIVVFTFSRAVVRAKVSQVRNDMRVLWNASCTYSYDWSIYPAWGIGRLDDRGWWTYNNGIARRTGNRSGVGDLPGFLMCHVSTAPDNGGFLTLTTGISFVGYSKGMGGLQRFPYTPYIPQYPVDPFCADRGATFVYWASFPGDTWTRALHQRYETPFGSGLGWIAVSPGPDGDYDVADAYYIYDPHIAQPSKDLLSGTNPRGSSFTYDPTNGLHSDGDIWRVHQ